MEFIKRNRTIFIAIAIIIILIGSVFVWNKIVIKQNKNKSSNVVEIDTSDVNNVNLVDTKLNGEDYKITQGYLLNYSKHKSSTMYMTTGYVAKITKKNDDAIIELKDNKDSDSILVATIPVDKAVVKVGDNVNFVGIIDIKNGELHLSSISIEEIEYSKNVAVKINDLIDNIELLRKTYFVVNGYMVTDGEKYKLYSSKDDYVKNKDTRNYFTINWDGDFNYTGNQEVKIRCNLQDTYLLGHCSLIK